jgi:transaldolase
MRKTKTKIFLDSANPDDTKEAIRILGYLDGQTTNPSLFAKTLNRKLPEGELWIEYLKAISHIRDQIPTGAISAEIYADNSTTHQQMISQAEFILDSDPDLYIKLPSNKEGIKTLKTLVSKNIKVNMTLGFDVNQAYAVAVAAKNSNSNQVIFSAFVGRLFDHGMNGIDSISNIQSLYSELNTPVSLLACSFRSLDQFLACLALEVDIVTVSLDILKLWQAHNFEIPKFSSFKFKEAPVRPIPFMDLDQDSVNHILTLAGITKFSADWNSLHIKN